MSSRNLSTLGFPPPTMTSTKSESTTTNSKSLINQKDKSAEKDQVNSTKTSINTSSNQLINSLAHLETSADLTIFPKKKQSTKSISICYPPALIEKRHLTAEEIALSIFKTLSSWQTNSELWLFAYGSLIWKPEGIILNRVQAHLDGYHRGLYLWSRVNRGTHAMPGLVLALDRGGSCSGIALQLCTKNLTKDFTQLWKREMVLDAYQPTWLPCVLNNGRHINALAFVIRRDISDYAGKLPISVVNKVITCAKGQCGSTLDYIQRTCEALRHYGIPDNSLEQVFRRCCRHIQRQKNLDIKIK